MKAKGTAVKVTKDFVKEFYPEKFEIWLSSLPPESKEIFENPILVGQWYPLYEAFVIPTRKIAELFFNGLYEKAAYEVGNYSAKVALKGIYKIFVKVASMQFIIKRAPSIYSTYYDTGRFEILESTDNYAKVRLSGINVKYDIFFHRMAGWMAGIIETVGRKLQKLEFSKKVEDNFVEAIYDVYWD